MCVCSLRLGAAYVAFSD